MSSRNATTAIWCLLSALNITALAVNVSVPSRAAVGGMNHEQLKQDAEFVLAVKSIVEGCRVDIDVAKVRC
jgi:hypothetical protein